MANSSSYEAVGVVKQIMELKTLTNNFTKREFVLTTEDDYPQVVQFECVKQQCALLDALAPGDRVRLEDGQWNGVVEACIDDADELALWNVLPPGRQRGVFVRYDEVGLVFYPKGGSWTSLSLLNPTSPQSQVASPRFEPQGNAQGAALEEGPERSSEDLAPALEIRQLLRICDQGA